MFLEPIANVRWFEAIKCAFPGPKGRPSILDRPAWNRWLEQRDDRSMSDVELLDSWPNAQIVGRHGLLVRIKRTPQIEAVDAWLLHWTRLHRFARAAIVEYHA